MTGATKWFDASREQQKGSLSKWLSGTARTSSSFLNALHGRTDLVDNAAEFMAEDVALAHLHYHGCSRCQSFVVPELVSAAKMGGRHVP